MRKPLLAAALLLLVALAVVPAASSAPPSGERIYKKQVLIPLYDWDTGKIMIGSTPVNCQYVETCAPGADKYIPKFEVQPFYLVVYPYSAKKYVSVECVHEPADNCPDHGPLIADGAKQLVPSVYGDGVWGHNHLSAPLSSKEYRVIAEPVLVLFKTRAAANQMVTTKAQVMDLVKKGLAFLYPAPQYTFINYVIKSSWYDSGEAVTPKPMKMP